MVSLYSPFLPPHPACTRSLSKKKKEQNKIKMPLRNDVHLAQRPECWLCWFSLGDIGKMTSKGIAFPIQGVETRTGRLIVYFYTQVNDKLMFWTRGQQAFAVRGQIPNIFRVGRHMVAISANRFCSYSRNTPVRMEWA